jgi:PhnB protein
MQAVADQGVFPMLAYEDGLAAMEWLTRVFGFIERKRIMDNERLSHGEMETGSGLIMLASPTPDYQGPSKHRENCEIARKWCNVPWVIDGVLVYVNDIEKHYQRSKSGGARILSEIQPGPSSSWIYRVEDHEGHRWMFMQRKEVN